MEPHERIIVALDVSDYAQARGLINMLLPHVGMFKIGLEFQHAMLMQCVGDGLHAAYWDLLTKDLRDKLMWDGKLHDIPNTVGKTTKVISNSIKATMFTMHASGGVEMMKAAVANKGGAKALGVTVLTSLDDDACMGIYSVRPDIKVPFFADLLLAAGADGIVCSPKELALLRGIQRFDKLLTVIPGIRLADSDKHDQARIMTPGAAVLAGADYLVIGRDIVQAKSPIDAAKRIADEIAEAIEHDTEPAPPVIAMATERT